MATVFENKVYFNKATGIDSKICFFLFTFPHTFKFIDSKSLDLISPSSLTLFLFFLSNITILCPFIFCTTKNIIQLTQFD